MPGQMLWAWDTTNEKWVKVKTDSQGRIYTVAVIDKLGDIGNVDLTDIADDDVIYWEAATSKWKNIAHLGVADAHHAKTADNEVYGLVESGSFAERPAFGIRGRIYYATDTYILYYDTGFGWVVALDLTSQSAHAANADAHHAKYTNAEAVSAVEAAGLALASGKNIKVVSALTADHTWSGLTTSMTAGEDLSLGQVCYIYLNGSLKKADKDLALTMPAVALATADIANTAEGEVLLQGFYRDDTWDWIPGNLLYVGDDGAITNTIGGFTTGDQVQVVGVAITADIIYFNPSLELVEIS